MYELTNHIHRYCGGRILLDRSPDTFTPGGNPFVICADCEEGKAEMNGVAALCMCGDERLDSHCVHREMRRAVPSLGQYLQKGNKEQNEVMVVRAGIWRETVGVWARPSAPPPRAKKNLPGKDLAADTAGRFDATERQRYPAHWGSTEIQLYHQTFRTTRHEHELAQARHDMWPDWPFHLVGAQQRLWRMTDHICRHCDARLLVCVKNNGMSPGGNPAIQCSGCGRENWSMGTQALCYCGWGLHERDRSNGMAMACRPYVDIVKAPHWLAAAKLLGQDPERPSKRRKIGVIPYQVARYIELKEATP